jgi:hypothetical protein
LPFSYPTLGICLLLFLLPLPGLHDDGHDDNERLGKIIAMVLPAPRSMTLKTRESKKAIPPKFKIGHTFLIEFL